MDSKANAPIIIKRKKVSGGDGHHGGAWKVAYADFVTAMMAFFLLMWLLNSTSAEQRAGIADYFSPTIPINRTSGGGSDPLSGDSIMTEQTLSQDGTGGAAEKEGDAVTISYTNEGAAEAAAFEEIESALLGLGGESMLSDNALKHIVTRVTDEGLVIEVFDVDGAPLFVRDTDAPTEVTVEIFASLARVLDLVKNGVAVSGHVRTQSMLRVDYPVWDLSTSRAARVRLLMESAGLQETRMERLTGKADRDHISPDPQALRNNRIEVIVLRSDR